MNDNSIDGAGGGVWDGIWRGKASSLRRNLANVAGKAARIATLVAEGARLVDRLPDADRQVEVLGIADELESLGGVAIDTAKVLRAEAGSASPSHRGFWARLFGD